MNTNMIFFDCPPLPGIFSLEFLGHLRDCSMSFSDFLVMALKKTQTKCDTNSINDPKNEESGEKGCCALNSPCRLP